MPQNQPPVIKGKGKSGNASKVAVGVAAGTVGGYVLGKALGATIDIIDHSSSSSSSDSDSDRSYWWIAVESLTYSS